MCECKFLRFALQSIGDMLEIGLSLFLKISSIYTTKEVIVNHDIRKVTANVDLHKNLFMWNKLINI